MRLTCILVAWIAGIAQIGRSESVFELPYLLAFLAFSIAMLFAQWMQWLSLHFYLSVLILFLSSIASFAVGQSYTNHHLTALLRYREIHSAKVTVLIYVDRIAQKSQHEANTWQQQVSVLGHQPEIVHWRVQYPVHSPIQLKLGHYYKVTGQIIPHHGYAVPAVFNQELWLLQQRYMASLQLESLQAVDVKEVMKFHAPFVQKQQQLLAKIAQYIENKRLAFRQWLQIQQLSQHGLILALVSADQSLLPEHIQSLFRRLGIMHLLAISGPHVLIFALLCCALVRRIVSGLYPQLFLYWPRPDLLLWPFVLCVWWYAAFVGFEVPALRTVLSVTLLSLLLLIKQRFSTLHILLLSASILLFFDPLNILAAAFWLSYISSLILIRIYLGQFSQTAVQSESMSIVRRLVRQLMLLTKSQWKIFIALLPLMLWVFQQFSWLAPLANCIAVPILAAVVVPLAVVASSVYQFMPSVAKGVFHLSNTVLELLLWLLQHLDQAISNAMLTPALTTLNVAGLAMVLILLFLPNSLLLRLYWFCCAVACIYTPQAQVAFELNVIDVGQGQAVLLKIAKQHLMIDLGGSYNEQQWGIGEHVLSPFLLSQGIVQLDQVIISHLDQDHRGGLSSLSKRIKIQSFLSNQYDGDFAKAGYADVPFQYCHQGQHWQYEGVRVQILAPRQEQLADVSEHKNDLSCIVYIQVPKALGYQNFLIMGDAGWPAEYQLMRDYPDLDVDVLLLGHHGSRHSSAYDFLKWLKPQLAVVSVGRHNRYGHPHAKVLSRLQALSIPLKQTQHEGTMRFYLDDQQVMQLELQRDQRRWLR